MSLVRKSGTDNENIGEYLARNPDFFVKNPELLTKLFIPHITPDNVSSLIEYQVDVLRRNLAEANREITSLHNHLENIRQDTTGIHKLTLQLVSAGTINEIYRHTSKCLKDIYHADRVLLFLFCEFSNYGADSDLKCLGNTHHLKFMFTEIFHRNKPLCNSLQEEHIRALFAEDHQQIKSTVILPLQADSWQGLLVTGSRKSNCYGHGFELDLLVYLGSILNLCITTILDKDSRITASPG